MKNGTSILCVAEPAVENMGNEEQQDLTEVAVEGNITKGGKWQDLFMECRASGNTRRKGKAVK